MSDDAAADFEPHRRYLVGLADQIERTTTNGLPGFVLRTSEGIETLAIDVAGDQIVAIYAITGPWL